MFDSFGNFSVENDFPRGGDISRAHGLPRRVLLEVRGEDHQGQALQVGKL